MSINKAFSEPWRGTGREDVGGNEAYGARVGLPQKNIHSRRKCCLPHCAGPFTNPRLKCLQKHQRSGDFCLPSRHSPRNKVSTSRDPGSPSALAQPQLLTGSSSPQPCLWPKLSSA